MKLSFDEGLSSHTKENPLVKVGLALNIVYLRANLQKCWLVAWFAKNKKTIGLKKTEIY